MPGGFSSLLWIALAVSVGLRVIGLDAAPRPSFDEGGWPLSVRQWALDGLITYDFHTAPGYHLVLGAVFKLAPPTMLTARIFSALIGLAALPLFWWIARRLSDDARVAAWATVILASANPAIDIARRALIEPIQMLWLLGVVGALTLAGPGTGTLVALLTAGLLLTKANAVVLLPVFAFSLWWDQNGLLRVRRTQKVGGLAVGVALAGLVFLMLYRLDPATFVHGWGSTMLKEFQPTLSPIVRAGRFVVDPRLALEGVKFLAAESPFLFAFGVVGAARTLRERRLTIAGGWILVLLPFLLLQVVQSPQYFSVLYPALALCAAALLVSAERLESRRPGWAAIAVVVMVVEGLARTSGALLSTQRPDRPTVEFLRERVADSERVLAAPFVLMQLRGPGTSLFELGPEALVPTAAAVERLQANWIVLDRGEWQERLRWIGIDSSTVADSLRDCCDLVHGDSHAWIYRKRAAP